MPTLLDEAQGLEPNEAPWRVDDAFDGSNWLIASFGNDEDGKDIHVTTDSIRVSEMNGATARDDAEWVVWCRNHWQSILQALDANGSPAGTDQERMDAMRKLETWNRGEPIRATGVTVLVLQSQDA